MEFNVSKTNVLRECIICHYWDFLKINVKFTSEVCNGCYGLTQIVKSVNDAAIVYIKGNSYRIHFLYMSKDETLNVLKNVDLTEKTIKKKNFFYHI